MADDKEPRDDEALGPTEPGRDRAGDEPLGATEPGVDQAGAELETGDVRTGGGTGAVGGGGSGAGDDDVGTGMGSGGGGVDVGSGIVSALDVDAEQQRSGRLSLNHEYSTGDMREYGTGGGDVGIGGDVSPHGGMHEPAASRDDVAHDDARFKQYEIVEEGGYLEHEGFPPEYAEIEDEDEPTALGETDPDDEVDRHEDGLLRRVADPDDEPYADVRDEGELFGT